MSIRDLVREVQREMAGGDMEPQRAADRLLRLTALLGNINEEIREADVVYARVLLWHLDKEQTANRARMRAEITPEYQRRREARDTKELAHEMIGGLKYYLRSVAEEMRLQR